MNINQFKKVSRFTSVILKIAAIWFGLSVATLFFSYFFTSRDVWFNFPSPDFTILNGIRGATTNELFPLKQAASFVVPLIVIVNCYVLWKGSQLFKYLADGHSPFSVAFSQSVKKLGLILIVSDILFPLIYSLLVTIMMESGYYYIVGVGASFLIGLILYAAAEIFNYAINLQQFADDTV
ncbi:DUF2975 domain-containing protein [Alkalibacterium kapii]|uniref:DUF2975 domain-containing protein n=1 Tax=Alkalibacterium kapii TaxID=426704 RepID=A0A511ATH2_9LACT|nr:DUF2975 domain-containing protein [Alkalibacterium kapii]GEK91416.1 hypothetical protein AKA01nite_10380 [Alkalibacterium kapii]